MNHPQIDYIERTGFPMYPYKSPSNHANHAKVCDCGESAEINVNGQYRCWDCAEDEGITRVRRSRP